MRIVADKNIPLLSTLLCGHELVQVEAHKIDTDLLSQADALIVRSVTQVDSHLLRGSSIRFVATATSGVDHIDLPWLLDAGIAFSSAAGANATAVADYVMAAFCWNLLRTGKRPEELCCGVVGVGHIGAEVLRRFRALGCQVLACDPPKQESNGLLASEFVELASLAVCDLVSFHVPFNASGHSRTAGLIDSEFLCCLPSDCLLINTSRGGVLNEKDAVNTLSVRKDIHLVLDVFKGEPNPDPTLVFLSDLATPHIAGYSRRAKLLAANQVTKDLIRFFKLDNIESQSTVRSKERTQLKPLTGKLDEVWEVAVNTVKLRSISETFKRGVQRGEASAIFNTLRNECSSRLEYSECFPIGQSSAQTAAYLSGLGFASN